MSEYCPHASDKLKCSRAERENEFYRQMDDSMLANEPIVWLTSGSCSASPCKCLKLQAFQQKIQRSK